MEAHDELLFVHDTVLPAAVHVFNVESLHCHLSTVKTQKEVHKQLEPDQFGMSLFVSQEVSSDIFNLQLVLSKQMVKYLKDLLVIKNFVMVVIECSQQPKGVLSNLLREVAI